MSRKLNPAENKEDRRVVCAAIKFDDDFMAVGARHFSPAMHHQLNMMYGENVKDWPKEVEQGFINTWDEFLTREEAAKIATRLGQCAEPTDYLYSEDLY